MVAASYVLPEVANRGVDSGAGARALSAQLRAQRRHIRSRAQVDLGQVGVEIFKSSPHASRVQNLDGPGTIDIATRTSGTVNR